MADDPAFREIMSLVTGGVSYRDAVQMTRLERHAAIQVLGEFNDEAERRMEQARRAGASSSGTNPRPMTQSSGAPPVLATWRP